MLKSIVSLAAAPGWYAIYGNPAVAPDEEAAYPLVAWAVENVQSEFASPGEQRVFGLVYMVAGDGVVEAEYARSLKGHDFIGYQYRDA